VEGIGGDLWLAYCIYNKKDKHLGQALFNALHGEDLRLCLYGWLLDYV